MNVTGAERERLQEELKNLRWELGKKVDALKAALREEGGARAQWAAKYDMLLAEAADERRKLTESRRAR